jgi:hypothetical protein
MSGDVWISEVFTDYQLGNKMGLRWKYPGVDWSPAKHVLDTPTDQEIARFRAYRSGHHLPPENLPEALAIWEPNCFARTGDMFSLGSMYVVRPKLADVFSKFDLGDGGLVPITIYEADLQTPAKGEYFMLQLGARKDTFLPKESNQEGYRVRPLFVDRTTGEQMWKVETLIRDGDVAVSEAALDGPDLWAEIHVLDRLFMSGALAEALQRAGAKKVDFMLKQCRVVGAQS